MPLIPLDNLLGAPLLGTLLSSIIYGISCLQVYLYFTEHSQNDTWPLKAYVIILMVFDTFHLGLLYHFIYYHTISSFGDYSALTHDLWSLLISIPVTGFIVSLVQGFFAYKIYLLSNKKNWWMPLSIVTITLGQLISTIGFTVTSFQVNDIFGPKVWSWAWSWSGLTLNLVCDTCIASSMIYYLYRSQTQFAKTNRAIYMLITYFLNTGLLVTVFAAITLALCVKYTNTYVYTPFFFMLGRLYPCTLLSILNSRNTVRNVIGGAQQAITLSHIGSGSTQPVPDAGSNGYTHALASKEMHVHGTGSDYFICKNIFEW